MLETNRGRLPSGMDAGAAMAEEPSGSMSIASIIGLLRRQFWIILLCGALGAGGGAAVLLKIKPNFVAITTLLIDTRKFQISQQPAVVGQMSFESSAAVESQLELLKSEKIALAVIKKLELWREPEFVQSGRGLKAMLFGGLLGQNAPPTEDELIDRALDVFAKHLTVKRIGITYAIDIGFESKYADRAAQIANTVADVYIEQQQQSQNNSLEQASVWLEGRSRELREQSAAAQRAVVEYKAKNNIVDMGGGKLINEQRLADLNAQLATAHAQETEAKAKFDQADAIARPDAAEAMMTASVGDLTKNEYIGKLRSEYVELANREADWSVKYGRDHLAVVNLRSQMQQIRSELSAEFLRMRESFRSDYELALQREARIKKDLSDAVAQSQKADQAQVELRQLQATAQTYKESYDSFLNRYTDSLQQQTSPIAGASIITRASPPASRNYKKTLVVVAACPAIGLLLGIGIAFLREWSARVFRTARDVDASLRLACVGIVPKIKPPKLGVGALKPIGVARHMRGDGGPAWTIVNSPSSRFTESIRSIKVAVDFDNRARSNRIIGFISALPDEGKSTMATAFGLLSARSGARVIIVDCDLRNPALTRALAPESTTGILELISGAASLEEVVWKDYSTQIDFLPASLKVEPTDAYDILASNAMTRLFEELRGRYELVIVDLPPLVPVIDVCATTNIIDSYMLVIAWGDTKIDVVEHALRNAHGVYDRVLGVILNKVDIKQLQKHDKNLAERYYGKYYGAGKYSST